MALYASVLTGGTNNFNTTSEHLNALAKDILSGQGVIGSVSNTSGAAPTTGAYAVNAQGTPDNTVAVSTGVAYVLGTPSTQSSQLIRAEAKTVQSVTIAANATGSQRFDYIYIKIDPTNANTPNVAGDNVASLFTSRSTSSSTDNGTPPTYGLLIAVVTVANGFSTITNSNITDRRTTTIPNFADSQGWIPAGQAWTYAANAGNREYTATITGDVTGQYSPGMKVRVGRSTTAPTQSMSFTAASSQYATKASPSGITFTDNFTMEAWVYLNSYPSASSPIIGRFSEASTVGWKLQLNTSGQVSVVAANSATNYRNKSSYQSVPLKRWVHVAATVNAAGNAVTVYLDGVSVSISDASTGAAMAIVQAAVDLRIGATSTPNGYLDGYVSEARVWSALQSQASIQSNMAINLTGSETNLVALYKGNGNFNDATSNANNLTANGGAIATQAANPFNNTEYGIITKVSYSNPSTTLTIFTGTDYNIPNMNLNNPSYSSQRVPYGFPAGKDKWIVESLYKGNYDTASSPGSGVWGQTTSAPKLVVPTGSWDLGYLTSWHSNVTSTTSVDTRVTLSTTTNSETETRFTAAIGWDYGTSGTMFTRGNASPVVPTGLTAATSYNLLVQFTAGTYQSLGLINPTVIRAVCAYL